MMSDLVNIKDKYGEEMMHFCRKYFSTILEQEGLLFSLLSKNFAYSRYLYEDIIANGLENNFKNYIYSLLEPVGELLVVDKTAKELLDMAGYTLYECKTEEEIQYFKRYYVTGEKLCTFRGDRLDICYVFFAVKKDVDEIKRNDFFNPMRQDKYGTSVISIQFTRGDVNTLSIKNRYNHEVVNPDATYSNNLENIIPGLTRSFERDYKLNISQNLSGDFEIPGYVRTKDGKYYKYNYEINNIYYCVDNIIIKDFEVVSDYQEKEKYIVCDYFIIDLVNKEIKLYDKKLHDSFVDGFGDIKKINIKRDKSSKNKELNIVFNNGTSALIILDKYNRIISYRNDNLLKIEDNFLYYSKYLKEIFISNILRIGNGFLYSNNLITKIDFPKLLEIKDGFLSMNKCINFINIPNVVSIGNDFISNNEKLKVVCMEFLSKVGNNFLCKNKCIMEVYLPNLMYVGDRFLQCNIGLRTLFLEKLVCVGDWFVSANKLINKVDFSSLQEVGNNFLYCNDALDELFMFVLLRVGNNFLCCNRCLNNFFAPCLKIVGNKFFNNNSFVKGSFDLRIKSKVRKIEM